MLNLVDPVKSKRMVSSNLEPLPQGIAAAPHRAPPSCRARSAPPSRADPAAYRADEGLPRRRRLAPRGKAVQADKRLTPC